MRRGFHFTTSSYSSFNFLRAGCGVLTMNTSAHLANRSRTCCALAAFISSATPRLFRLANWKGYGSSECGCGGMFCPFLHISPWGGSTLITSAPKSDRIVAAPGPAMKLDRSTTFKPEKILSVAINTPLNADCDLPTAPGTWAGVSPEKRMYLPSCPRSQRKWQTAKLRGSSHPQGSSPTLCLQPRWKTSRPEDC